MTAALYYTAVEIRKNAWKPQTDREQRLQLQRPLLSPVDHRGERANKKAGEAGKKVAKLISLIKKYLSLDLANI